MPNLIDSKASSAPKSSLPKDPRNRVTIKIWHIREDFKDGWGHAALETENVYLSFRPDFKTEDGHWPSFKDDMTYTGRSPDTTITFYSLNADKINNFCKDIVNSNELAKRLHDPSHYPLRARISMKESLIYIQHGKLLGTLGYAADLLMEHYSGGKPKYSIDDQSDIVQGLKIQHFIVAFFYPALRVGGIEALHPLPKRKAENSWVFPDPKVRAHNLQIFGGAFVFDLLIAAHQREMQLYNYVEVVATAAALTTPIVSKL